MKRLFALLACGVLLVTGCVSTARLVEARTDGGIIAIPSNSNHWPNYHRDTANMMMAERCPNGYTILEEKEVVLGKGERLDSGSLTVKAKEWHINFQAIRPIQTISSARPPQMPDRDAPPPIQTNEVGMPPVGRPQPIR